MTDARAMQGDYADLRIVKGRKVVTMMIEFPLEQFTEIVAVFGGPQPDSNVPVAVARLQGVGNVPLAAGESVVDTPQTPKPPPRDWFTMAPSQRAGILCNEVAFQEWLREYGGYIGGTAPAPELAANRLRALCHVSSRKAFDTEERARLRFEELETEYLRSVGRIAEAR